MAYDIIHGIKISFAVSGYNLSVSKNTYVKIFIWIMLAFNLILVDYKTVNLFTTKMNISSIQKGIAMYKVSLFWFYYHAIWWKLSKTILLISSLSVYLKDSDTKRCYYFSFSIIVWNVIRFLSNVFVIDIFKSNAQEEINRYGLSNSTKITILFASLESIWFMKYDWTTTCNMFYVFIFYVLYRGKFNLLNSINIHAKPQLLTDAIYGITDKIIDLHSMFESIMSLFPFLTISNLFFAVSQNVYFIKPNNVAVSVWLVSDIIVQIAFSLFLVFITNYLSSKLKDGARIICKSINSDSRLGANTRTALVSAIEKSVEKPITGWGMFDINLSLILSFMSSHVTFTILFLTEE